MRAYHLHPLRFALALAPALVACGARTGLRSPDVAPLDASPIVDDFASPPDTPFPPDEIVPDVVIPPDAFEPPDVPGDVPRDVVRYDAIVLPDVPTVDGGPIVPTRPYQAFAVEVEFQTRIRSADVFFLVDNSASMDAVISTLTSSFSTQIVPGLRAAIGDLRVGVGSFDSMPDGLDGDPGSPGDYTLWVRQRLDPNAMLSQTAFNAMRTVDMDHGGRFFGGDGPEDQTESTYEAIQGDGSRGFESDEAARRSVHNALDPTGDGWVARMAPARDCAGVPGAYGWACFEAGRVPIVVLASDAEWWDGPPPTSLNSPHGHSFGQLVSAMWNRGGYFVGVDVGTGVGGATYTAATTLARATRTLDAHGQPIVFGPGAGDLGATASQIVDAITTIAGQSAQDVSGRALADPGEHRLPAGHTTADFVRGIVPARAIPEAPAGYDHRDGTTFYGVAPSTHVYFDVVVVNDFVPPGPVPQTFRVTIVAVGRAGAELDRRDVFITVPAM